MQRAYYSASIDQFLTDHEYQILGELTDHHSFALDELQKNGEKVPEGFNFDQSSDVVK